jgi:hypothetical protein
MLKARNEAICVPTLGRRARAGHGVDYVFSIDGDVGAEPLKVPMVCRNNAEARSKAKDLLDKYPIFERIVISRGGAVVHTLAPARLRPAARPACANENRRRV